MNTPIIEDSLSLLNEQDLNELFISDRNPSSCNLNNEKKSPFKYSYNELSKTIDTINEKILLNENTSIYQNVAGYEIREKYNDVLIILYDYNPHSIITFRKNIIDQPFLTFEEFSEEAVIH